MRPIVTEDDVRRLVDALTKEQQQTAALRAALMKIRDEVDHFGKDHAFSYCNEIARRALLATPEATS